VSRSAADAEQSLRGFASEALFTRAVKCGDAHPRPDEKSRHPDGRLADLRDLGKG